MSTSDPRRRDRTRPLELVGLAGVFAVFVGGMMMLFTRQWVFSLIAAGVTFILSLVVLAMLILAVGPTVGASSADEDGPLDPAEEEPDDAVG